MPTSLRSRAVSGLRVEELSRGARGHHPRGGAGRGGRAAQGAQARRGGGEEGAPQHSHQLVQSGLLRMMV